MAVVTLMRLPAILADKGGQIVHPNIATKTA